MMKSLMTYDTLQRLLTLLTGLTGTLAAALVWLGCSIHAVTGAIDCSATTSVPTWAVPYLVAVATGLPWLKTFLTWANGRFGTKTVMVDNSGSPGTVTPSQVAADLRGVV